MDPKHKKFRDAVRKMTFTPSRQLRQARKPLSEDDILSTDWTGKLVEFLTRKAPMYDKAVPFTFEELKVMAKTMPKIR